MKTSDLLKRAERHLWDGIGQTLNNAHDPYKSHLLCHALKLAADSQDYQADAALANAKYAIEKALDDCVYYSQWAVQNKHLPGDWHAEQKTWFPILQANRLNWLRELQRQFKLKGD